MGREGLRRNRSLRWVRFEPLTARAGARLVRMAQSGRLHPFELRFYLDELTRMDRGTGRNAGLALFRLAQRRAVIAAGGSPAPFFLRRQPAGHTRRLVRRAGAHCRVLSGDTVCV